MSKIEKIETKLIRNTEHMRLADKINEIIDRINKEEE